jgi:hypothetical protein
METNILDDNPIRLLYMHVHIYHICMRRVTITLPDDILSRVDNERNDVTRSRYVLRLLEKAFQLKKSTGESK